MHTSATCAVNPPSRGRRRRRSWLRPRFACFNASTTFELTFRSASPPPTEKTNTQSLAESLLTRSHPTNAEFHPSSFVRAVSSDTLSAGVYASMPVSLRKSAHSVGGMSGSTAHAQKEESPLASVVTSARRRAMASIAAVSSSSAIFAVSSRKVLNRTQCLLEVDEHLRATKIKVVAHLAQDPPPQARREDQPSLSTGHWNMKNPPPPAPMTFPPSAPLSFAIEYQRSKRESADFRRPSLFDLPVLIKKTTEFVDTARVRGLV